MGPAESLRRGGKPSFVSSSTVFRVWGTVGKVWVRDVGVQRIIEGFEVQIWARQQKRPIGGSGEVLGK